MASIISSELQLLSLPFESPSSSSIGTSDNDDSIGSEIDLDDTSLTSIGFVGLHRSSLSLVRTNSDPDIIRPQEEHDDDDDDKEPAIPPQAPLREEQEGDEGYSSITKKSVSFNKDVTAIVGTISRDDYCESEYEATWYTREDYDCIKKCYFYDVAAMKEGRTANDDICFRGIEHKWPVHAKRRRSHKNKACRVVFEEQQRQWELGISDVEELSTIYKESTSQCAIYAQRMGLRDAMVAKQDMNDSFFSSSSFSSLSLSSIGSSKRRVKRRSSSSTSTSTTSSTSSNSSALSLSLAPARVRAMIPNHEKEQGAQKQEQQKEGEPNNTSKEKNSCNRQSENKQNMIMKCQVDQQLLSPRGVADFMK